MLDLQARSSRMGQSIKEEDVARCWPSWVVKDACSWRQGARIIGAKQSVVHVKYAGAQLQAERRSDRAQVNCRPCWVCRDATAGR